MDLFFLVHGVPKLLPPGWCPVAYSIFGIWPDIKGIPCLTFPQLICQKWHCPHYISRSESQSSLTTCLKSPDWQLPNPGYELSLSEFREQSLCLLCGHLIQMEPSHAGAQACLFVSHPTLSFQCVWTIAASFGSPCLLSMQLAIPSWLICLFSLSFCFASYTLFRILIIHSSLGIFSMVKPSITNLI